MSAPRPGTAVGDCAVYSGRTCLGFTRGSVGGVIAFTPDGKRLGSFPNRKAAAAALTKPGAGHEP